MRINYSDKKNEIAYHYFYDFDLDIIGSIDDAPVEEMQNFMAEKFYYFK